MKYCMIILSICILLSCSKTDEKSDKDVTGKKETSFQEAEYFPSKHNAFKTAGNARFNFWFDLPKAWNAVDKSENGDGYFIMTGDTGVDVRIYGNNKVLADEEYYKMLLGEDGEIMKFKFRDGLEGKRVLKGNTIYFIREEKDRRISLYIESHEDWYKKNMDTVIYIARSIRIGEQE